MKMNQLMLKATAGPTRMSMKTKDKDMWQFHNQITGGHAWPQRWSQKLDWQVFQHWKRKVDRYKRLIMKKNQGKEKNWLF